MSDSLNVQNPGIISQAASYAAFPAAIQGVSGVGAVVRHKGIRNALKAQNHQGFKNLATNLDKDVFSKSIQIANEYDAYKGLVKSDVKLTKKLAKAQNGLPLAQKVQNLFRSADKKVTQESLEASLKEQAKTAKDALKNADEALDAGKSVIKATSKEAGEAALKEGAKQTFSQTAKGLIKNELKSKINIFFAGVFTFWPTFKENAIPAFKNDGIVSGLKETAKALGFGAADLGASAVATTVGGAIGGALGSIFCLGVGTHIGRTIGSAVASMFVSCKIADAAKKAGKYTKDAANSETQGQTQPSNPKLNQPKLSLEA